MSVDVTLLGTGGPIPAPDRAGPSTLVTAGDERYLVDAGRGVLMRLAACGTAVTELTAVLITHLHSDHVTDLNDVITTRWIMSFESSPLTVVGPPGTALHVERILISLGHDIDYRLAHHDDLVTPPAVDVIEVTDGTIALSGTADVTCAPTDHRPVEPSVAYRFDHEGTTAVIAGDTVPCDGLDRLAANADVLVHTVIRKDIIEQVPVQRLRDTLDYHSSPVEAGATAFRAGVGALVLVHCVPPIPPGEEQAWTDQAATAFTGSIVVGTDLQRFASAGRLG